MAAAVSTSQSAPSLGLTAVPGPSSPISGPAELSPVISEGSLEVPSSSTSVASSRPASQQSSRTSQSYPPSVDPELKEATSGAELSNHAEESETPKKGSRQGSGSTITASAPVTTQDASSRTSEMTASAAPIACAPSSHPRLRAWITKRQWFGNSVGLATLVATLVGLLIFGFRTYKLDIYNSHIAYRQVCQGQVQINGTVDSACRALLALPVPQSPYKLIGRGLNSSQAMFAALKEQTGLGASHASSSVWLGATRRIIGRAQSIEGEDSHMDWYAALLYAAIALLLLWGTPLVMAAAFLIKKRRKKAGVQKVSQSAVRNEVRVTRHHPGGNENVTSEQGVRILKHYPEEQHYLGQLRQSIRHILERDPDEQEALSNLRRRGQNTQNARDDESLKSWRSWYSLESASTLVTGWTGEGRERRPSNVTIRSSADGEDQHHGELIELKTKGKNKTFFDPKTGEFIRLTPWKSTEEVDDEKIKGDVKGSAKKALARMGTGAVAFGGGKCVDDEIMEELDRENVLGENAKSRIPQRAGDTIAGLVTNEYPTGRPTTV